MDVMVHHANQKLRLLIIYRPPDQKASIFLSEFADLIASYSLLSGKLIILGDFNFHVDISTNSDAQRLLSLLDSMNLQQHVDQPTHIGGHTLDLVITRLCELTINNIHYDDSSGSDHFTVMSSVSIPKPKRETKVIECRKFKQINFEKFKDDINNSQLHSASSTSASEAVELFNRVLLQLLDNHAPCKHKTITLRPDKPWHNEEIRAAKLKRRELEMQWRQSGLAIHRQSFKDQRNLVSNMCETAKTQYYREQMAKANNPKDLYKVANNLLHRKSSSVLPGYTSAADLADRFANFFTTKIVQIRDNLAASETDDIIEDTDLDILMPKAPQSLLSTLEPATQDEVSKLIRESTNKSCSLDPCPTWIIKECQGELLPVITHIINLSLSTSIMPDALKEALINPLIKKALLNSEIFKNYRPVSNLTYISKLIERVVAIRVKSHLKVNGLYEIMQSAYMEYHSTETALVKVQNDLLQAVDKDGAAILVLLDLSSAFDTIDHAILITTLRDRFGITGTALKWFESYLSGRFQTVIINGSCSKRMPLQFGVPQGSGLGPLLFILYAQPIADIIRAHGLLFHIYADDTQIYISFNPKSRESIETTLQKVSACVLALKRWMKKHSLKFNDTKTEVLVVTTPNEIVKDLIPTVEIGNSSIIPTSKVRNLGVQFDSMLNLEHHVNTICRNAYFQIRSIGHIRKYLDTDSAKTITHALVTSRLDYCNSLLYGLPDRLLHKLQRVQNTSARLVSRLRKYDHISSTLVDLHWLPVHHRIDFKILVLTYQALNGDGPQYIKDMLVPYKPARSLRSQSSQLLKVPITRLSTFGDRSFEKASAVLWNKTPLAIRTSPTLGTFKSRLKTHLFKCAFNV